ncbi:hypothetical protein FOHLNKBM_6013 [Methylobacterium longum]|nr:hypothetical protein FOHLNKBM_6013 [Methylobacterium longum]
MVLSGVVSAIVSAVVWTGAISAATVAASTAAGSVWGASLPRSRTGRGVIGITTRSASPRSGTGATVAEAGTDSG